MMKNRATEEHKIWLFDLAHGDLSESQIVKGFNKFYNNLCIIYNTFFLPNL